MVGWLVNPLIVQLLSNYCINSIHVHGLSNPMIVEDRGLITRDRTTSIVAVIDYFDQLWPVVVD